MMWLWSHMLFVYYKEKHSNSNHKIYLSQSTQGVCMHVDEMKAYIRVR